MTFEPYNDIVPTEGLWPPGYIPMTAGFGHENQSLMESMEEAPPSSNADGPVEEDRFKLALEQSIEFLEERVQNHREDRMKEIIRWQATSDDIIESIQNLGSELEEMNASAQDIRSTQEQFLSKIELLESSQKQVSTQLASARMLQGLSDIETLKRGQNQLSSDAKTLHSVHDQMNDRIERLTIESREVSRKLEELTTLYKKLASDIELGREWSDRISDTMGLFLQTMKTDLKGDARAEVRLRGRSGGYE